MTKACCILLISLGFYTAQAQSTFQLSGRIIDSVNDALSHATVRLIVDQDTLSTITRDDGNFTLKSLIVKRYKLLVTMKGYLPFTHSYVMKEDEHSVHLPPIALRADYNELDPVTISRVRPITFQDDTVSYHVAAFPVRDGSEVEDILKRLPGIEVNLNGDVIIQGKKVQRVLVNGKEFFGGDVLLAIRNLPADVVDKLQVIDDYGDKALLTGVRSGEAAKVLNIILKQDKRNGEFGRIQAGGGNEGKYAANAFGNAFHGERQVSANGSISNNSPTGQNLAHNDGINYADQWDPHLGGLFNYTNNGQNSRSNINSIQDNFYSGEQQHQTQNSQTNTKSNTHNLKTQLTYKPDRYSTLRINISANLRQSFNQSVSSFTTLQQDSGFSKSTIGQSLNKNQSTGESIGSNVYYEKIFPNSRRRFSISGGVNISVSRQNGNNQSTATVLTDSTSSNSFLHYLVSNNEKNWSANIAPTYFMPLGQLSFLELGYNVQTSQSQTNLRTQTPGVSGGPDIIIDSLSQNQLFNTITQNLHAGYSAHFHNLDLSASLNGQQGVFRGSTDEKGNITSFHYFSVIPNLESSWNFNKTQKVNLNYNRAINLPGLQQLTPYTNLSNPQYPIIGNPGLKPSFTNSLSLHYELSSLHPIQFQGFGVSIGYTTTGHTIIQDIIYPKDSSQVIQETTYANAGTTKTIFTDYHLIFPLLLKKRFRINLNGSFSRNQTPTMVDGLLNQNYNWTWSQSFHSQLLIPDIIETGLEGNYTVTHATYRGSGNLSNIFKTALLSWTTRQYLLKQWALNYELSQPFTSNGTGLMQAPAILTASIQRQFLSHNKATITLTGYNLLNSAAGTAQSSSPNGFTQTKTQFIGRYFFCTFLLKLNNFKK